jgi:filamentous hemagglutinin
VIKENGRQALVRFDGFDGEVLIDRKLAVPTFPKTKGQAIRQSEALRENGVKGRWEVPTKTQEKRAHKLFDELEIDNIGVKVVPDERRVFECSSHLFS